MKLAPRLIIVHILLELSLLAVEFGFPNPASTLAARPTTPLTTWLEGENLYPPGLLALSDFDVNPAHIPDCGLVDMFPSGSTYLTNGQQAITYLSSTIFTDVTA